MQDDGAAPDGLLLAAQSLNLQRRLLLEHVLRVELGHLGVVRGFLGDSPPGPSCACAPAQLLLARVLRDAQVVEVGLRAGADRFFVQLQRVRRSSSSGTALPPAKISWRPCSSYHLVSVAVMCIFSMMLRQPMPVL